MSDKEDDRFSGMNTLPMFKKLDEKAGRVKLDERFHGLITDERFQVNSSLHIDVIPHLLCTC